jgi:hypothetical protein
MLLQIQAIDRQITRLERHVIENNLQTGWLAIKEKIDALIIRRTAIYERLFHEVRKKLMKDKESKDKKGKGKGT